MHLENEINEQPEAIKRLLKNESDNIQTIAEAIRKFDPTFVHIAARGTSDNAARYAQYFLGSHTRLPVMLATPSLHTLYETPPRLERSLTIGISQSGKAEDVRQVIEDARSQGALTVSITNDAESPLAKASDYHIYIHAGPEISIAATKTYTTQLTAVAMLVDALAQNTNLHAELLRLPEWVSETLTNTSDLSRRAERYRFMDQFVAVGRGYNYCTALEVSLKVKELCYITGEGYSEADFRHGPIAMVGNGYPVLIVAPKGKTLEGMRSLMEELGNRGAETIVISNDDHCLKAGTIACRLPADIPEYLAPIAGVVPGQVFGMRLAMEKGLPVDKPRGLSKVTVTR